MPTFTYISRLVALNTLLIPLIALNVKSFGSAVAPPPPAAEFSIPADRLRSCIGRVLREHGQTPSALRQKGRVLLVTPFSWISADELERISRRPGGSSGKWMGGRYRLLFAISGLNSDGSELAITSQILADPLPSAAPGARLMGPGGPMRGIVAASNGLLERRWREILKKRCGG